ncbi:MAG: hypothetical protein R2738_09990 [Bacteroides graminisolvens]
MFTITSRYLSWLVRVSITWWCTDTSGNESYVAKSVVFDANAEEDVD